MMIALFEIDAQTLESSPRRIDAFLRAATSHLIDVAHRAIDVLTALEAVVLVFEVFLFGSFVHGRKP